MPFFSIIIPLYNKAKHVQDTIKSVLAQSFVDYEILIIDDGSTDESVKAVQDLQDSRIKLFKLKNRGVSHARNYGIQNAASDLIVLLDADDSWLPSHLEDLKCLYDTYPNCGMYAKAYAQKDHNRIHPSHFSNLPDHKHWHGVLEDYFFNSLKTGIASSSSVMIPKSSFEKVGYFNESYSSGEDTDLWIRIALDLPVAFDSKLTAYHNLHTDHKVSHTPFSSRAHFDLMAYEDQAKKRPNLKKYLDLNRVSMALQYKLEGHSTPARELIAVVDPHNLTRLQRILLKSPKFLLQLILNLKRLLFKLHIDLRLFR